ncbi:hypothetical protein PISL3812_03572 [Talaromyces islandicus]|uniref:Major facilitator superfamily (MFS) profile domain-containing protein n=1 Tax=Talaromyces islandicus TaxID=28573 RepID=A0A0U1LTX5_TALIS|nr:hypothetical protein PISL3812_03572 [Talaromyces islandicus]
MLKDRDGECAATLVYIRSQAVDSSAVQYEFCALRAEHLVAREAALECYGATEMNWRVEFLEYRVEGIVNFVMTFPAVFLMDNIGRKPTLCWGEANMAISDAQIAAIIAVYGDDFETHAMARHGAVFLIYWHITNYVVTLVPIGWVVVAEVFPLNMRAKGVVIVSAVN